MKINGEMIKANFSEKAIWLKMLALAMVVGLTISACSKSDPPVVVEFRGNPISGEINGTLGLDKSPYLATDTLKVSAGSELVIEPGVELRFEPGIPFVVEGKVTAIGAESAPITFTSGLSVPDRGDWDGIWLMNANQVSKFEYCKFTLGAKYGRRYHYTGEGTDLDSTLWEYGTVTCMGSAPEIKRSWFIAGGFHGVYAGPNSAPIVENCVFHDNAGHGIYLDPASNPVIDYNIIIENDDYGIFFASQGDAQRADTEVNYNIIWSNFSGEYNIYKPAQLGRIVTVNGNQDSCDYRYNLRLNPDFTNSDEQDYRLDPCSAAIDAGPASELGSDLTRKELGIYAYSYRAGEIRRLITVDKLEKSVSPYYMTCDLRLRKGTQLTVEPGVEVFVEGRYQFKVDGKLTVGQSDAEQVRFTSGSENPVIGDWLGFLLSNGGDTGSSFRNTEISYSHVGIWMQSRNAIIDEVSISYSDSIGILCDNFASPFITDCQLSYNSVAGILCNYNSSPLITRNEISYGTGNGIWAKQHSRPEIKNNLIYNLGTDGIKLDNLSSATIVNNTIAYNGYFGLYCSDNSSPDVKNNIFVRNGSTIRGGNGVYARRTSLPTIEYNCFWDHARAAVSVSSNTTMPASNIAQDPKFVNVSEGSYDFHLQSGSPALTAGDPQIAAQMGAYGGPDAVR